MISDVKDYLVTLKNWQAELTLLRDIVAASGLVETYKWKHPCYTLDSNNVILLHEFKHYCALLFFKGALLKDSDNVLVRQTEHVQSARQIRFTSTSDIEAQRDLITRYILEAIEIDRSGIRVESKEKLAITYPEELDHAFAQSEAFAQAFKNLTPGRQRGYLLFFSKAKQAKTRVTRIEKYRDRILCGKGINDCVCGRSKKMPNCDGSHKYLQ
jgi:uncharacterized protein YdeI (YjbR/CyaY-like superfamily)